MVRLWRSHPPCPMTPLMASTRFRRTYELRSATRGVSVLTIASGDATTTLDPGKAAIDASDALYEELAYEPLINLASGPELSAGIGDIVEVRREREQEICPNHKKWGQVQRWDARHSSGRRQFDQLLA